MKGFRSLVLQDLPYVLPTKNFQNYLAWNLQLPATQLHTTASSRRFWNFFEFSPKEEPCRNAKKCPSSEQIVSSTLLSSNEIDTTSKTIGLNPKAYGYQFDLKSTPMTCLKIPRSSKEENLTSMLDGNPVPTTLKWKLKGYKTLRNEQAGDFAFVPGGKTYDFDILTKSNNGIASKKAPSGKKTSCSKTKNKTNTLCLTTKAIENKEKVECTKRTNPIEVKEECITLSNPTEANVEIKTVETTPLTTSNEQNICNVVKSEVISDQTASLTTLKLLASSTVKKEETKFLPISISELSSQTKYQTQSTAQYSSRPPKNPEKPVAPVLKQSAEEGKKLTSTMESLEEKQPMFVSKPPLPTATQISENVAPKEQPAVENQAPENPASVVQFSQESYETKTETAEKMYENELLKTKPPQLSVEANDKNPPESLSPRRESTTYFAPRSSKQRSSSLNNSKKELSRTASRPNYETIIGMPERAHPTLNIINASENKNVRTSPCAATQARLQQKSGNISGTNQSTGSFGPSGSSMPGNSGNGSRKPPASYPPFTTRRSSSNSSCLTKNLTASGGVVPRKMTNSKINNNASSISTSCRNSAPRKCDDNDEPKCNRNRRRRRKCERQERPKCKTEKDPCKRYCCPALQKPVTCDYSKFQCPNNKCGQALPKFQTERDPTCLPNEEQETREVCTQPRRRSERSCKRERPCKRERRDSCSEREEQPCRRRRSCKRQEQEDCDQSEPAREICTKPRKRETCKRQRKCNDRNDCGKRSAKCSGRRNYTQSAYKNRTKLVSNVKRYSSLPAFAFPLIGMRVNAEWKQKMLKTPINEKFFGSTSSLMKDDSCKKNNPCKKVSSGCGQEKENPCKKKKSGTSCGAKKDACKKASTSCGAKSDACKKVSGNCGQKEDACKKKKPSTSCGQKKDVCKKLSGSCGQKKEDSCRKTKPSTSCGQKKEPCKKSKSTSTVCGKKQTPCKKSKSTSTVCGKKQNACKKAKSCSSVSVKKAKSCGDTKKKADPCGKSKSGDTCSQKRTQLCEERMKVASPPASQSESAKERTERERKEMEQCKKDIKPKKKKEEKKAAAPGLERVISPCKQQKDKKGSCKKFAAIDIPLNSILNRMSGISVRQLVNVSSDRSYCTVRSGGSNDLEVEKSVSNEDMNYWKFNENDDIGFEELPVPVVIENQEDVQEDNPSLRSNNWFFSWFNASID